MRNWSCTHFVDITSFNVPNIPDILEIEIDYKTMRPIKHLDFYVANAPKAYNWVTTNWGSLLRGIDISCIEEADKALSRGKLKGEDWQLL